MGRFDKLEIQRTEPQPERTAREKPASSEPAWLEQAIEERRCGHYENALRLYSRALEEDKSLVTGWLGQVQMLILLDEAVEAELWSRKALELFPNNGDLLAGRAQAMNRMDQTPAALAVSDGALKSAGQSAYRWMVRGELLAASRQDTDRHCFDKAMQADRDWLVPLEIARIYLYLNTPSRAVDRVRRAVELAPTRFFPWYIQGLVERELGMEAAAAKSWTRCLELCPGHADADRELRSLDEGGWSVQRVWRRLFGGR